VTPGARLSAAIAVLDRILGGAHPEQALTNWGSASRYAGSSDRAAVRDLVFDALRCRRSRAGLGGGDTGRGLVLGGLRALDGDLSLFSGEGHAPAAISDADTGYVPEGAEAVDCPDWLYPLFQHSLEAQTDAILNALRQRAPVFLRVNPLRATMAEALASLAVSEIAVVAVPDVKNALQVTANARKIQNSPAYLEGFVELQDASSQAVVEALGVAKDDRVLDYCAGGGGKTLALAALVDGPVDAHDIAARRMVDLPARAARAGAQVRIQAMPSGLYDLVLVDAPCSGSGSWRRDPMGKWALTPAALSALHEKQSAVMDAAARHVAPKGRLAYATCSLLDSENQAQVKGFLARHTGWSELYAQRWTPLSQGDGFFLSILTRN
jgi:16S rRNA (cytosine967-C5)-methyltransferase